MTLTPVDVVVVLFRTLDDAILGERGNGTDRASDRILLFDDLFHATCGTACLYRWPAAVCISPYAELLRLTRRPGPMHAAVGYERWNVMQRYRWCDRRPMKVRVQRGSYVLEPNQAVLGDDGKRKRGTRQSDWPELIVETWAPAVDPAAVIVGLEWLVEHFAVPLQLPKEVRKAVAA